MAPLSPSLALTPRLSAALCLADRLARRRGAMLIGAEHLFLVLADQSGSPVRSIVWRAGYDPDRLWEEFREVMRIHKFPVVAGVEPPDSFTGGEGI